MLSLITVRLYSVDTYTGSVTSVSLSITRRAGNKNGTGGTVPYIDIERVFGLTKNGIRLSGTKLSGG